MKEYTFTHGKMTMAGGKITLRTPIDIAAPEEEQQAAIAEEKKKQEDKAKSSAERQKEHRQKMKDAGWRKVYVDPVTIELGKELGGIENIAKDRAHWMQIAHRASAKTDAPAKKFWWKFW